MKIKAKPILFAAGIFFTIAFILAVIIVPRAIDFPSSPMGAMGTIVPSPQLYSYEQSSNNQTTEFQAGEIVCFGESMNSFGSGKNFYRLIFPDYSYSEGSNFDPNICYDQPLEPGTYDFFIYFADSSEDKFTNQQTITITVK